MRQLNSKLFAIKSLTLVALCATLLSFTNKIGGDVFEVYLNNKQVMQQFLTRDASVRSIDLRESNASDMLRISYSHCGQIASGRSIAIKDGQNKSLKVWNFADGATMAFEVKDVQALQKLNKDNKLNLFYSSKLLPDGRILASLIVSKENRVSVNQ